MLNLSHKIFLLLLTGLLAASNVTASDDLITSQQSINVVDNRVTLHLEKADIREVLQSLADHGKFTLHLGKDIKGTVTLDLQNVTIEQAVQSLTDNLALEFTFDPHDKSYKITHAASFSTRKNNPNKEKKEPSPKKQTETAKQPEASKTIVGSTKLQTVKPEPANAERDSHGRLLYKPGELLVTFNNEATDEQIQALHTQLGSTVLKQLPNRRLDHIQVHSGLSVFEAIKIYKNSGLVTIAGPNTIRYPSTVPDDTFYTGQWNMDIIQAPEAWNFTSDSIETIVAIIDTGVIYDHPDLEANIWVNKVEQNGITGEDDDGNGYVDDIHGWDFADADNDPSDPDGHGTHVAGVIGAVSNNGIGVAGINWHTQIMPLKVMQDNDTVFTTVAIIEAMDYATQMGARIINCSYGGSYYDETEYQAMVGLRDAGLLATCAAGNDGQDIDVGQGYPAAFDLDNIISVAASTATDEMATFSNYGVVNVDLAAPGETILSTIAGTTTQAMARHNSNPPQEYESLGLEFAGTTSDTGLTSNLVDCKLGTRTQCTAELAAGNIALIERGDLYFSQKVTNAQRAGAIGAIIYDNVVSTVPFNGTLVTSGSWIPAIAITKASGEDLLNLIATNPSVTLVNKLVADPTYDYLSGTSMAAPHVAGSAALLYGINPNLNYQEVRDTILNSVDPIPAADGITVTGGRLNIFKAIQQAFPGGDVNGDNTVSLADAILILQFLSYQNVEFCPNCRELGADINGDGLTRHEEAIYILQKISDLR